MRNAFLDDRHALAAAGRISYEDIAQRRYWLTRHHPSPWKPGLDEEGEHPNVGAYVYNAGPIKETYAMSEVSIISEYLLVEIVHFMSFYMETDHSVRDLAGPGLRVVFKVVVHVSLQVGSTGLCGLFENLNETDSYQAIKRDFIASKKRRDFGWGNTNAVESSTLNRPQRLSKIVRCIACVIN